MPKSPKAITLVQTAQAGCGDLLEAVLFAPQGSSEHDFLLGADVRFGSMLVASEDWSKSVEIGLAKATLSIDLAGCEIDPSVHRYGDKKQVSAKTHVQRTQVATANAQIDTKASLGASARSSGVGAAIGEARIAAGHSKGKKLSSTETQVVDSHEEPVVALSGNRWRFSAVSDSFMQSRYAGHEALCKIQVTGATVRVDGRLSFQPKDIVIVDIECISTSLLDSFKKSPNKTAIAKVLLSKHLKEINPISERASGAIIGWVSSLKGDV
jgi:hypothetical protein